MDRLGDGLVYLCRASGEGSHDFRVCHDEAGVGAFYQEMTGEDEGGGIDSLWRDFRNPDCWDDDGTALELELYCAKFEVWKVDARQLTVAQPASITQPAQIGGTIFHPGVAAQTVIDRAYREHDYQQTPEREAERMAKVERFRQAVSTPQSESGERPCATCNDDPAVCATVPGLRHCEAAQRSDDKPSEARWACGWVAESSRCMRLGCGKSGPCEGVPRVCPRCGVNEGEKCRDFNEAAQRCNNKSIRLSGMPFIKTLKDQRDELAIVLRELLRLYDWRNEVGGAITDEQARQYGREKKAAWIAARAILEKSPSYTQQLRNLAEGLGMTYEELCAAADNLRASAGAA